MKCFQLTMRLASIVLLTISIASQTSAAPSNKQLTIGMVHEFDTLNSLISQTIGGRYIGRSVVHSLITINADWQWQCLLCTEVPTFENGMARLITKKGKKRLVVDWQIKANAKWGDGIPVTGYDLQLAWKVGKSPNVAVGSKDLYEQFESIEVDRKNPKKFTITYDKPRYDYYHLGTVNLLPHHIEGAIWEKTQHSLGAYEKQSAYTTQPTHPGLYCGPYRVEEVKVGSHVMIARNPHYYGKKPKIDKIVLKIIPNTQAMEANLLSGTIDMISESGLEFDQALAFNKRLASDTALQQRYMVKFRQGTMYEHIDLNLSNPVLQDIRVRQALVHAINRQALVDALFKGKQQVALHNINPLDPYFTDAVMQYPYDPKRAARLLDKAGWKLGQDGMRAKDGKKLSFVFITTAENKTRELVQVFLQNEWKKIGIKVRLKNLPPRVFFSETLRKRKFSAMAMYAWISSPDNPPRTTTHSLEIPTAENGFSGQNYPGYKSVANDRALDQIQTEFDFGKRKELMKTVQQEYAKELPVIPLYYRAQIAVIPKNLKGFRLTGHQFYSVLSIDQWNLQ